MSPDQPAWDNLFLPSRVRRRRLLCQKREKFFRRWLTWKLEANRKEKVLVGIQVADGPLPQMIMDVLRWKARDEAQRLKIMDVHQAKLQKYAHKRSSPQQGYPEPRRGPGPNPGYGPARQNTYGPGYNDQGGYAPGPTSPIRDNFGPPSRSMTMPNEPPVPMGRQPPMPASMDAPGPSAPYNGPVGRGMPPRPSTASGNRPQPGGGYPSQGPAPDPYANGNDQSYNTHSTNRRNR